MQSCVGVKGPLSWRRWSWCYLPESRTKRTRECHIRWLMSVHRSVVKTSTDAYRTTSPLLNGFNVEFVLLFEPWFVNLHRKPVNAIYIHTYIHLGKMLTDTEIPTIWDLFTNYLENKVNLLWFIGGSKQLYKLPFKLYIRWYRLQS